MPKLSLDATRATRTSSDVRVFAQLVDDDTDIVLGNQVTPIPLKLDGEHHSVKRPLEAIAHTLRPGSSVTLQITASATNYGSAARDRPASTSATSICRLPTVKARASGN